MARRSSELKLERSGFEFHSFEYADWVDKERELLSSMGYETKVLRERSDTIGLKMFSVWKRRLEEEGRRDD